MMFVDGKFCPHCGATAAACDHADLPAVTCIDCKTPMRPTRVGQTVLHECERCHGLWVDTESFRRICAERERQSDVLGAATTAQQPPAAKQAKAFRYRSCPCCDRLMNRYNFANASRVVIDACKAHGVWFDRDELRQIIEFIRAGGMEVAQQRQLGQAAERQRWAQSQRKIGDDADAQVGSAIAATIGLPGFFGP